MNKIYIARKYISTEGGARHYYEEGIFSSYEMAHDFILHISEEDDDSFLSEIVSYPLDKTYPCDAKEVFTFNRKGELLISYDAHKEYENCYVIKGEYNRVYKKHSPESYSGKFKVGDIVFIKAFPWNKFSPTHINTIGVIANIPISYDKWIANGHEKHLWDNSYVVDCIRDGYLGHWHIEEKGIDFFKEGIPSNLRFLNVLSDHYQKKNVISDEIFNEIISGKIFIEKVKHFVFETA